MIIIGLTGATGAGKGLLSKIFEKYKIHSLDTDLVSRIVCQPNFPCTLELAEAFGEDILLSDGSLDRKALSEKVFMREESEKLLSKLNAITHRHILAYVDTWLEKQKSDGAKAAVVDAPLLFESGYDKKCDYIIGVVADKKTRIKRIIERDMISAELAEKRAGAQKDDEYLMNHCSVVFTNNGDEKALESQALFCIKELAKGVIPKN